MAGRGRHPSDPLLPPDVAPRRDGALVTAIRFVLAALDTGRLVAHAVIATDARYCSIAWIGAGRLERRYLTGPEWLDIEREIERQLPPTPLPKTSPIVVALLDFSKRSSVAVQYLTTLPIEAAPGEVVAVLDGMLRQEAEA